MKKITLLTSLTSFFLATSSFAGVVFYDFESPYNISGTHDSKLYTIDGVNLSITAWSISNDGNGNISAASQVTGDSDHGVYGGSGGLGVETNSSDSNNLDAGDSNNGSSGLNGKEVDEGLLFSFDYAVNLSRINFGSWGSSDDFNLTINFDGSNFGSTLLTDFDSANSTTAYTIDHLTDNESDHFYFQNVYTSNFLIWADSDSDSFRIDDLTISVPEPSVIALLGLGLTGLGLFSRKRKRL